MFGVNFNKPAGYYTDSLLAAQQDGVSGGNYGSALAEAVLQRAQNAIRRTGESWIEAHYLIEGCRTLVIIDSPDNPYFEDVGRPCDL